MLSISDYETEYPTLNESKMRTIETFLQDELVFLYYHSCRSYQHQILSDHLKQVLECLKKNPSMIAYLKLFYRMIGQTRDLISGKGEHDITYMMISVWYKYYPVLAIYAVYQLPTQFGCWRDVKYLCQYLREHDSESHPLIDICVEMTNRQFISDIESWKFSINAFSRDHISNVAKWIPREHKKFDWLYEILVIDWAKRTYPYILQTAEVSGYSYINAVTKCKRLYRKQIAYLNKVALETAETKPTKREPELDTTVKPKTQCSQKRRPVSPSVSKLVKKGFAILLANERASEGANEGANEGKNENNDYTTEINELNQQWIQLCKTIRIPNKKQQKSLLPVVDVSYSMQSGNAESYYTAIGLAILMAERSSLGMRIMAYDQTPIWIIIDDEITDFYSILETIYLAIYSNQSTISNLKNVIDLIQLGFSQEDENLCLVVLSDNQNNITIMNDINIQNTQNKIQIVFWNLSKREPIEFDHEQDQHPNRLFLSGFSPCLIEDLFVDPLKTTITAYDIICRILNNPRYNVLEEYIDLCCGSQTVN